jgi:hypothetical protein
MTNDLTTIFDTISPDEADPHQSGKLHAQRAHDDYSTSEFYIKRVRRVFGGSIACDPASSDADNVVIRALIYYTHENSGLAAEAWSSPWYLNPPSIRRDEFLARAAQEARQGGEAIICLNLKHLCAGYTQYLLPHVAAVHIPRGRPAFVHPTTRERSESPTDGRAFLYVGKNPQRFIEVFRCDAGWTFCCELPLTQDHGAPRIVVR